MSTNSIDRFENLIRHVLNLIHLAASMSKTPISRWDFDSLTHIRMNDWFFWLISGMYLMRVCRIVSLSSTLHHPSIARALEIVSILSDWMLLIFNQINVAIFFYVYIMKYRYKIFKNSKSQRLIVKHIFLQTPYRKKKIK